MEHQPYMRKEFVEGPGAWRVVSRVQGGLTWDLG